MFDVNVYFLSLTLNVKDNGGIVALSPVRVRGGTHQLPIPLLGPESERAVPLCTVLHRSLVIWRRHHQTPRPPAT